MIKRPLALSAVVFVMVLAFLYMVNDSIFWRNPVKSNGAGEKQLDCFLQDDAIKLYGVVSDYDYREQYGKTTTELYLADVHILAATHTNDKSNTNSDINSKQNIYEYNNELYRSENWKKVTRPGQKVILYINKEETLSVGETILLSGRISFFESAVNPGQFDAERYYANKDILFSVKKAVIEKRSGDNRSLRQRLKVFADKQEETLDYFLPDAYASILKAMLIGNKKELDEETKELYQDNGIAHILAISGLHISMLGMAVYRLLRRLPVPHWISLFGSEIFLLLYGGMVGFSTSAFRAIGMFTFFLCSKICKRSYDMLTAAAFTGMLQLLIHPGYLFDCGFQLSYAAILGMAILLPAFQELVKEIKIVWIQKAISLLLPSLSVTLFTAPVLIFHYHELSFFSILLNVVVIPFVSVLLLLAIFMLMTAHFLEPLSWLCTIPIKWILGFYEWSCRFLELFPVGQNNIAHPAPGTIICYFSLLFTMTVLVKKKRNKYQFLFSLVAAVLILFPQKPEFTVWMLDVGQGDCSVIFTEEGKCFVIDCGSTSEHAVGEKRLIPFLKYHGVGKVDAVFVSHADADHMNGIKELLECGAEENIKISCVMLHEQALQTEQEEWNELVEAAHAAEVPIIQLGQGDGVRTSSMSLTCLYPLDGQQGLTGNASSMVLMLETEEVRGLFTGDMEMEGERILIETYVDRQSGNAAVLRETLSRKKEYTFLKVGHHGSSGSTSSAFLQWTSPDLAFISCGRNNSYGHPHQETLNRLEEAGCYVFMTSKNGAITMNFQKGKRMTVQGWIKGEQPLQFFRRYGRMNLFLTERICLFARQG